MSSEVIDIDLTDDDDIIEVTNTTNFVPKKKVRYLTPEFVLPTKKVSCLNPECKNSNETLIKASDSVRRYYGVEAYYKKRKICKSCLHTYNREKGKVVNLVRQGINIFSNKITLSRKTFIISESDSDDSNLDDSSDDSECEFDVLQIKGVTSDSNNYFTSKSTPVKDDDIEELQKTVLDIIQSNNLHKQIPDGSNIILQRLKNAQAGFNICNKDFNLIEKNIDVLRNEFYAAFQDDEEYVSPIEIGLPERTIPNTTVKRFSTSNATLCNDSSNSQISSSTRHEPISEVTKNPISSLPHTFTPKIVNPKSLSNQKLTTRPIQNSNISSEIIIIPEESDHVPLSQAKNLSFTDPFRIAPRSIANSNNNHIPVTAQQPIQKANNAVNNVPLSQNPNLSYSDQFRIAPRSIVNPNNDHIPVTAQQPILNANNVVNNVPLSQGQNLSYSDPFRIAPRSIANPGNNDYMPVTTTQQPILKANPLSQAKNPSHPDPFHIAQINIANPNNNDHLPVTVQQPTLNANNLGNTSQLVNIPEEPSHIPLTSANNCYPDYFIAPRSIANPNNNGHVPVTVQQPIPNANNVMSASSPINISEDHSCIPLSPANNRYSNNFNFQNSRSYSPTLPDKTSYRPSESPSNTPTQLDTCTTPPLEEMNSSEESNNELSGIIYVEPTISNELKCLPPVGPLIRHQIRVDDNLYVMRFSKSSKWVEATVINIEFPPNGTECMFGVRFVSEGINEFGMKTLSAKSLAYFNESPVRVPFGTRIIAAVNSSKCFYVGIVAEIPTVANKYRYLVFFDYGHSQYVRHSDIRIVAQDNLKVWEDVESRQQSFIKNYLETYPEKTMIRLQKYSFVQTELNGLFYSAQVTEVDCSLAKVFFPVQRKDEWLYRGSSRFQPLFEKKLKYNQKMESETPNLTFRRRTVPVKKKAPVIEYVNLEEPTDILTNLERPNNASIKNIAENKKLIRKQLILEKKGKKCTFVKDDLEIQNKRFVSHQCNKKCDINSSKHPKSKDVSPLLKPILYGWKRQFTKVVKKTVSRDICMYVAPCGRRLRSYDEICRYLKITCSHFTIDMFTLDMEINLFRTWEPADTNFFVKDITCGQEEAYISAVNSIDSSGPKEFKYCSDFIISDNVSVNLDPNYLVCCKCEDNCLNKSKCECWQLTIEAAKSLSKKTEVNENTGYNYKRLYEQVPSGIFECNSECSCKKGCLNRVVQFSVKQKLQLFKTAQRGWGVRTLNDIPNGTFICMYVGKVITDTQANQEGRLEGGDEYFANLDYIEIVEEEKDGYECSVTDIEEEEESDEQSSQASEYEMSADSDEDKKRKRRKSKYEKDKEFKLKTNLNITETRKRSSRIRHRPEGADEDDSNDSSKKESINFEPDELGDADILTKVSKKSLRDFYREAEAQYVLDAKVMGNIGRYLNHSCDPNVYCQNVFVNTHDPRFPQISFFASKNITAGTELTWDYNYEIDSVPNRFKKCFCRSANCKGRLL